MLNGSNLNGAVLNGGATRLLQRQVVADNSYVWALRVIVGGVDRTADLTGIVRIDREEGAAGIAELTLHLDESPIVPITWIGRSVTIDYLSQSASGSVDVRRFTGRIAEPVWSPLTRTLACQCTDNLQQRAEALSVAAVDALVGGYWSADVFAAVEGRSRWDYAQERMQSRPASLDCSVAGELRVTSWYAQAASYVFGGGTTLHESVQVDLPLLTVLTNVVGVEADYRYPRLIQRNQSFSWSHPLAGGFTGLQGFCQWVNGITPEIFVGISDVDMPTKADLISATEGAGLTMVRASWTPLPASGVYCTPEIGWTNDNYPESLIGASWTGGERWVQTVTEQYRLRLVVEPSIAQAGEVIARDSASAEVESAVAEAWTRDPWGMNTSGVRAITGSEGVDGEGLEDLVDAPRRAALLDCLLNRAAVTATAAHRLGSVSWSVPTSMALDADLVHTLEVDDQGVHARGKCRRVVDEFDLASGMAITTLTIAVMRGGAGVSDPLVPPAVVPEVLPPSGGFGTSNNLPTQLGGLLSSPPYDDTLPGFSGNYSKVEEGAETFTTRFDVPNPEIDAIDRDEHLIELAATYRLNIPDDLLELT